MNILVNLGPTKFSLNGVHYFKNFAAHRVGDSVRIVNVYDSRLELVPFSEVSEFLIDGQSYNTIEELSTVLVPVLYVRSLSSVLGGILSVIAGTNVTIDNTDPLNPIINVPGIGGITLQQLIADNNVIQDLALQILTTGLGNMVLGDGGFYMTAENGEQIVIEVVPTGVEFYKSIGGNRTELGFQIATGTFKPILPAEDGLLASRSFVEAAITDLNYSPHFKGVHLSLSALQTAHPTAAAGDEAHVNEPGATKVVKYLWDAESNEWVQSGAAGSGATNTDQLPEGSFNLYFTGERARSAVVTGLAQLAGTPAATDTFLQLFGKLWKRSDDNAASITTNTDAIAIRSKNLINDTTARATVAATGNQIVSAYQISLLPSTILLCRGAVDRSGTAGSATYSYWLNTSNSLSGATKIGEVSIGATQNVPGFVRGYAISATGMLSGFGGATSAVNDAILTAVARLNMQLTVPGQYWLIVVINLSSSADTLTQVSLQVSST